MHARRLSIRLWWISAVVSALLLGALAAPAEAQRIRPSFWGMHDGDWTTPPSAPVGSANLTVSGTYWRMVETANGRFDWTRLDQQVAAAEAVGAQPMVVLGQTPRFHSPRPRSAHYDDHMPRMAAWQRWVTRISQRYGTRLDYQIWPEPNIIENWKGSPQQMAQLTAAAGRILPREAVVVGPAVALRLEGQRQWMKRYYQSRVGGTQVHRFLDAVAIDPFPLQTGTPEDSYRLILQARRILRGIGVRTPLWSNEINYGVAGGNATTKTTYSVDTQQAYVIRTYVLSAAARVRRTYWLGWFTTDIMGVHLATASGRTRPPGEAYALVRTWLNGTRFRGCTTARGGLWTCTARKGGDVRRIYWDTSGRTTVRLPRSRVSIQDQEGRLDRSPGAQVRVGPRPVLVVSRG